MRALCIRRNAGLLYGTNFSIGVQAMLRLTRELARDARGYEFSISETHHATKLDQPSGTALSVQQELQAALPESQVPITSHREGEHAGLHVLQARSGNDLIEIRHEAFSRRGFAEGAIRAAEWLSGRTGCYAFAEIFPQLP